MRRAENKSRRFFQIYQLIKHLENLPTNFRLDLILPTYILSGGVNVPLTPLK